MSHHFDTPSALEDPRINVSDVYLFQGAPGMTVMAMTVNPDAGISAPVTFREEGVYAFHFDTDSDAREDVTFKCRFGEPFHPQGDERRHVQSFAIRRTRNEQGLLGDEADLFGGLTGEIIVDATGAKAFAGLAPDLFAGDAEALKRFEAALLKESRFDPEAFMSHKNSFEKRNVTAIVLEVPSRWIGSGRVRLWATVSLQGHAPELQVSRWGLPLITHIYMSQPLMKEAYNRAIPANDVADFWGHLWQFTEKLVGLAGSAVDPAQYADSLMPRLLPTMLPYYMDTTAEFAVARFNGRPLTTDVMDVMLTLAANRPLSDGVAPEAARAQPEFPYFGKPYSAEEQADIKPAHPPAPKNHG